MKKRVLSEKSLARARVRAAKWAAENQERARANKANHYARHGDEIRERSRQHRLEHLAESNARAKKWAADNRERLRQVKRQYAADHKEEFRLRARERARRRRLENPEPLREAQRKWRALHPEEFRAGLANRRASKFPAPGKHTAADIKRLYQSQGGKCAACSVEFAATGKHRYHVDHIVPLKPRKGGIAGSNGPENLQLLCRLCNQSKNNMSPEEWAARQ